MYADQHGFKAVWLPERHFQVFGGSFPNPNPLAAALSQVTQRIRIRAGSVNIPQHASPLRVAEDWALVDNLSGGRVDISFGAGWNVVDFVLEPKNFLVNKERLWQGIQAVRTLWQGGAVTSPDGFGRMTDIRTWPRPTQPVLEVWVSAVINPQMFWDAGAVGSNMLVSVFGQTWEELGEKISMYRKSLAYHGFDPTQRTVTCLVHTLTMETEEEAQSLARGPLEKYMLESIHLIKLQFPDIAQLPDTQLASLAAARFMQSASLIGSVESCRRMADRIRSAGINEIACLLDFGVAPDKVMHSLRYVGELRQQFSSAPPHMVPAINPQSLISPYQLSPRRPNCVGEAVVQSVEQSRGAGCLLVTMALSSEVSYLPGQHVVLHKEVEGEMLYVFASISTMSITERTFQVALREGEWPPIVPKLPGLVGSSISVDGGHGWMLAPSAEELEGVTDLVLIGGGTGMAALHCILQHLMQSQCPARITVLFSWKLGEWPSPPWHRYFSEMAAKGLISYVCAWTGTTTKQQSEESPGTAVWHRRVDLEVCVCAIAVVGGGG